MTTTLEPGEELYGLTVEDYHRMTAAGIFGDKAPVELLDGMLVAMVPEGPTHADVIDWLNRFLVLGTDRSLHWVRVQHPLTVRPRSEPEPDFAIILRSQRSRAAHPESALLAIEVAHSSLRRDRGRKQRIYAEARIPEYWIVNLRERCVEIYTDPQEGGYAQSRRAEGDETITPTHVPLPPLDLNALFNG